MCFTALLWQNWLIREILVDLAFEKYRAPRARQAKQEDWEEQEEQSNYLSKPRYEGNPRVSCVRFIICVYTPRTYLHTWAQSWKKWRREVVTACDIQAKNGGIWDAGQSAAELSKRLAFSRFMGEIGIMVSRLQHEGYGLEDLIDDELRAAGFLELCER